MSIPFFDFFAFSRNFHENLPDAVIRNAQGTVQKFVKISDIEKLAFFVRIWYNIFNSSDDMEEGLRSIPFGAFATDKEVIIMLTCPRCGSMNPDYYTQCPNCGTQLSATRAQNTAPPSGYSSPMYTASDPVTSVGEWFLWSLLIGFLPLIGTIIMFCTVKDPSAKNAAKVVLIMQIVAVVFYILAFAAGLMGALTNM